MSRGNSRLLTFCLGSKQVLGREIVFDVLECRKNDLSICGHLLVIICIACAFAAWRAPPSKRVKASAGPTAQVRMGHDNHCSSRVLWNPPLPVSVKAGKNAADATPT